MTQFVRDLRQDRESMRPPAVAEPELAELTAEIVALWQGPSPVAPSTAADRRARRRRSLRRRPQPRPSQRIPDTQRALRCAAGGRGIRVQCRPDHVGRLFDDRHGQSARAGRVSLDRVEPRRTRSSWAGRSTELRQKSFLDVVHPDDRRRAEETFAQALERGEALGLVVRMRTAHGKTRAIEVNVGARYGTNQQVTHLRCHLTDVTEKVRAERELGCERSS